MPLLCLQHLPLAYRLTPKFVKLPTLQAHHNDTVVYVSQYRYDSKGRPWAMVFDAKTDHTLVGSIVNSSVVIGFNKPKIMLEIPTFFK